jgi:hypothetical protein
MTSARLERVAGDAAPALARATRLGFGAKGLLTIIIGVLALRHALGRGGELTGPEGAIRSLRDQPLGRLTMVVLVAGLAAYALWMFLAAFVDPERKGAGFAGIAERIAFFVTGIGYAVLAWAGFGLFLGNATGAGRDLDDLAATVLTPVAGRWLVGLVGAAVMISGILQMRLGITTGFRENLRRDLSRLVRVGTIVSGGIGYLALGVLSLLVGFSFVRVALEYDPSEAGGWDEALGVLSTFGQGAWALGAAAAGLILYGVYFVLLVKAKAL